MYPSRYTIKTLKCKSCQFIVSKRTQKLLNVNLKDAFKREYIKMNELDLLLKYKDIDFAFTNEFFILFQENLREKD